MLAELRTFHLLEQILSFSIIDINKKTVKDKDVDLIISSDTTTVYIEVYANNEALRGRTANQRDAKLERTLKHGLEKFLNNECNLAVLADEDLSSINNDFDFLHNDRYMATIFNGSIVNNLERVSGVIILNQSGHLDESRGYKYTFAVNPSANRKIPPKLLEVLKSNGFLVEP